MVTIESLEQRLKLIDTLREYPDSQTLLAYAHRTGLHIHDVSEEGLFDKVRETLQILFHRLYISVNRAWAKLTRASEEVRQKIEEVAHRPNADISALPLSRAQVAGIGVAVAAATALLGGLAGKEKIKETYKTYYKEPKERRRAEEEKRRRLEEKKRKKAEMYKGLSDMYHKAIDTGSWLNDRSDEINHATAGFMKASKIVSGALDTANTYMGEYSRKTKTAQSQANESPDARSKAHHEASQWRNYGEPAVSTLTKVAKFLSGEHVQEIKERRKEEERDRKERLKEEERYRKEFEREERMFQRQQAAAERRRQFDHNPRYTDETDYNNPAYRQGRSGPDGVTRTAYYSPRSTQI